jgi:hypothetical protein
VIRAFLRWFYDPEYERIRLLLVSGLAMLGLSVALRNEAVAIPIIAAGIAILALGLSALAIAPSTD